MKKIAVLLIISLFAFTACGMFSTPIKKIVENPREYESVGSDTKIDIWRIEADYAI